MHRVKKSDCYLSRNNKKIIKNVSTCESIEHKLDKVPTPSHLRKLERGLVFNSMKMFTCNGTF